MLCASAPDNNLQSTCLWLGMPLGTGNDDNDFQCKVAGAWCESQQSPRSHRVCAVLSCCWASSRAAMRSDSMSTAAPLHDQGLLDRQRRREGIPLRLHDWVCRHLNTSTQGYVHIQEGASIAACPFLRWHGHGGHTAHKCGPAEQQQEQTCQPGNSAQYCIQAQT